MSQERCSVCCRVDTDCQLCATCRKKPICFHCRFVVNVYMDVGRAICRGCHKAQPAKPELAPEEPKGSLTNRVDIQGRKKKKKTEKDNRLESTDEPPTWFLFWLIIGIAIALVLAFYWVFEDYRQCMRNVVSSLSGDMTRIKERLEAIEMFRKKIIEE